MASKNIHPSDIRSILNHNAFKGLDLTMEVVHGKTKVSSATGARIFIGKRGEVYDAMWAFIEGWHKG